MGGIDTMRSLFARSIPLVRGNARNVRSCSSSIMRDDAAITKEIKMAVRKRIASGDYRIALTSKTRAGPSSSGHDTSPLNDLEKFELAQELSEAQCACMLAKRAERPHSGLTANGFRYNINLRGTYVCAMGGLPVFHSSHKVEKGFGHPTFTKSIAEAHTQDNQLMMGMLRCERMGKDCLHAFLQNCMVPQKSGLIFQEVTDVRAGMHLGWSFCDPLDGKEYYCVNAASLYFIPDGIEIPKQPWHPAKSYLATAGFEYE